MPPPSTAIKHVFVLMLENRSFDHMLGFSGITGTDAETGLPTQIGGLSGKESNEFAEVIYPVTQPADWVMPVDPSHEFTNVVTQLCGMNARYVAGGPYPAVNNSGFVLDYFASGGQAHLGEIMKCYGPGQLPVLNALAREFAVLDRWFSSLPGPTWPNRFFAHAASSGGLDHSPSGGEIGLWEVFAGFRFEKGTLFDSLNTLDNEHAWRIYSAGGFPCVAGLKGITNLEIHDFDDFAGDVGADDYPVLYTFIEPDYGDILANTYRGGSSQHPLDDVTHGEAFIKSVYESIRNSPVWASSLLILTWDEHGGFYDHVAPPEAVSPGDAIVTSGASQFGFTFQQYGVRVPAVAVSPLIPRNLIDHRTYDHASIPATVERVFGLKPLTRRDAFANSVESLATLAAPRTDAPLTLPDPVTAPLPGASATAAPVAAAPSAAGPADSINKGNLPGFLHAVLRTDLDLSPPGQRPAILARFNTIKTRAQAKQYMDEVLLKAHAAGAPARNLASRTKV